MRAVRPQGGWAGLTGLGPRRPVGVGSLSPFFLLIFSLSENKRRTRKKVGGLENEVGLADKFPGLTKMSLTQEK